MPRVQIRGWTRSDPSQFFCCFVQVVAAADRRRDRGIGDELPRQPGFALPRRADDCHDAGVVCTIAQHTLASLDVLPTKLDNLVADLATTEHADRSPLDVQCILVAEIWVAATFDCRCS